jgi:HNH endonuclease
MGSTRDARRAGIAQAASATPASTTATPVRVNASRTGTPNTRLDTARPSASPPRSPLQSRSALPSSLRRQRAATYCTASPPGPSEGAHMLDTFRGTRTLRYLWHEQRGLCTLCNTKITRITGWRLHYCVPRVKGGSTGATNCVLLHPECHDRVHRQRLPVSKPRLL